MLIQPRSEIFRQLPLGTPQFGSRGQDSDISPKEVGVYWPFRDPELHEVILKHQLTRFPSLAAAQSRYATHPAMLELYGQLFQRDLQGQAGLLSPGQEDRLSYLVNRATLGMLMHPTGEKDFQIFSMYRDAVNLVLNDLEEEAAPLVSALPGATDKSDRYLQGAIRYYRETLEEAILQVGTKEGNLKLATLTNTLMKAHPNRQRLEITVGDSSLSIISRPRLEVASRLGTYTLPPRDTFARRSSD